MQTQFSAWRTEYAKQFYDSIYMDKKKILTIALYVVLIGAPVLTFIYLLVKSRNPSQIIVNPVNPVDPVIIDKNTYSTYDYFDLYRLLRLTVGNFCFNSICGQNF